VVALIEAETIINFNKEEAVASVYTHEAAWQTLLEKKLGLKPTRDYGGGAKEYEVPKEWIMCPRPRRRSSMTPEQKVALAKRGKAALQKLRSSSRTNACAVDRSISELGSGVITPLALLEGPKHAE